IRTASTQGEGRAPAPSERTCGAPRGDRVCVNCGALVAGDVVDVFAAPRAHHDSMSAPAVLRLTTLNGFRAWGLPCSDHTLVTNLPSRVMTGRHCDEADSTETSVISARLISDRMQRYDECESSNLPVPTADSV